MNAKRKTAEQETQRKERLRKEAENLKESSSANDESGFDPLDEALEGTFPASDPPSWTPVVGPAARD